MRTTAWTPRRGGSGIKHWSRSGRRRRSGSRGQDQARRERAAGLRARGRQLPPPLPPPKRDAAPAAPAEVPAPVPVPPAAPSAGVTWFQRHEDPKATTDASESTYVSSSPNRQTKNVEAVILILANPTIHVSGTKEHGAAGWIHFGFQMPLVFRCFWCKRSSIFQFLS